MQNVCAVWNVFFCDASRTQKEITKTAYNTYVILQMNMGFIRTYPITNLYYYLVLYMFCILFIEDITRWQEDMNIIFER